MCECCKGKKPIKIMPGARSTHFSTSVKFIIDGLKLKSIYHFSEYVDIGHYEPEHDEELELFDINYCPMCGRDLRGKNENE